MLLELRKLRYVSSLNSNKHQKVRFLGQNKILSKSLIVNFVIISIKNTIIVKNCHLVNVSNNKCNNYANRYLRFHGANVVWGAFKNCLLSFYCYH